MSDPIRVLLQTTIASNDDDWSIARFSLLREYMTTLRGPSGETVEVTARDRDGERDSVLESLARSQFDEVWLFAVDSGTGLTAAECAALGNYHRAGGGLLITRDHADLGSSVSNIVSIGAAHHFHTRNLEPDASRHIADDPSPDISWPNYHSGPNGDVQRIEVADPVHPLLRRGDGSTLEHFPSHPHEGAVSVPRDANGARVIATGKSLLSGRPFNLAVAFEGDEARGRAVAQSSFHHFVDYNWDTRKGAPSFVVDPPVFRVVHEPHTLNDIREYVRNVVFWLAGVPMT